MDNNDNLYRLINEEIDGTITPTDLKILKKTLVDSEEARRIYDQIRQAANIYGKGKEIEPPSDLKDNIMRAIDSGRYAPSGRKTIFGTIRAYTPGFRTGYAWSFAGGVLVGVLILAVGIGVFSRHYDLNETELTGTIVAENTIADSCTLKREAFGNNTVSGKIEAVRNDNTIRTQLRIVSEVPVNISIKYDNDYIRLMELLNIPNGLDAVEIGNSEAKITHNNDGVYNIVFEKIKGGKSSIDFLLESDTVIYVSSLAIE